MNFGVFFSKQTYKTEQLKNKRTKPYKPYILAALRIARSRIWKILPSSPSSQPVAER